MKFWESPQVMCGGHGVIDAGHNSVVILLTQIGGHAVTAVFVIVVIPPNFCHRLRYR